MNPDITEASLGLWPGLAGARLELINLSENHTFLVRQRDGNKTILRVHRPGYHKLEHIRSELAWMAALRRQAGIATPIALTGADGELVQIIQLRGAENRFAVLFKFEEGEEPQESADLVAPFKQLGVLAARCHAHVERWKLPQNFSRLTWDADTILNAEAHWGDWRDGPGVSQEIISVLALGETEMHRRLSAYGRASDRFGLIHADMRLANLLIHKGETKLIDFDDCGFGWFGYDFAAAISFFEDAPIVPELFQSWLEGYLSVRELTRADIDMIDTLILLRRYALLAWIGSHDETDLAAGLAQSFAMGTAALVKTYLAGEKIAGPGDVQG